MNRVHWKRLFTVLGVPYGVYALVAELTEAQQLIPVLTLVLIAMSVAVVVAFIPNVVRAFTVGEPFNAEASLCLGIFFAWADYIGRAVFSLTWRLFPGVRWIADSDFNSAILFGACFAAGCHLIAPAIDDGGRVPAKRWAKLGLIAGAGVLAALLVLYWPEVRAQLHLDTGADDFGGRIRPAHLRLPL